MRYNGATWTVAALGAAALVGPLAGTVEAQEIEKVRQVARSYFDRGNLTLEAGGGFMNFTEEETRDLTDIGGTWTVRAILGAKSVVGLEAAYLGSAAGVDAPGAEDATVVGNGLEALIRGGYPMERGELTFVPYGALGLGLSFFALSGGSEGGPAVLDDNDVIITVPLGVGLFTGMGDYSLDLRLMFRPAYGDDMFEDVISTAGMNTYAATATVGYSF